MRYLSFVFSHAQLFSLLFHDFPGFPDRFYSLIVGLIWLSVLVVSCIARSFVSPHSRT